MSAADKCHLNIPFKEYLKGLRVDGEGKLSQSQLDRVAAQEFENYKAIERRVNDPGCAGGECTCVAWYGYSTDLANGTSQIALSASTSNSVDIINWQTVELVGTAPTVSASGAITMPSNGWYTVSVTANLYAVSGSDPVMVGLYMLPSNLPMPTFNQGWAARNYAPASVLPQVAVSGAFPFSSTRTLTVGITMNWGSAATRAFTLDGPGDNGGVMMSIIKHCGCTAEGG